MPVVTYTECLNSILLTHYHNKETYETCRYFSNISRSMTEIISEFQKKAQVNLS